MNQIFGEEQKKNKYFQDPRNFQNKHGSLNNIYQNNQLNNYYYANNNNYTNYDYEKREPKKRKIYNSNLRSIIISFCVFLILFGSSLIGSGVVGVVNNRPKKEDVPIVKMDKMGNRVTVTISTEKPIQSANYSWGSSTPISIDTNGTINVKTTIKIIEGNNILRINVTDYYGNVTHYQSQFVRTSEDSVEPIITVSSDGEKINIVATDDQKMAFLTYKWGNEEEIRVEADESNPKSISAQVAVRAGENTLVINAEDAEGNRAEPKTYDVKAAHNPTFTLSYEDSKLIVSAKDDIGLKTIIVVVDGNTSQKDVENNKTEDTLSIPVSSGQHNVEITITNVNGFDTKQEGNIQV